MLGTTVFVVATAGDILDSISNNYDIECGDSEEDVKQYILAFQALYTLPQIWNGLDSDTIEAYQLITTSARRPTHMSHFD